MSISHLVLLQVLDKSVIECKYRDSYFQSKRNQNQLLLNLVKFYLNKAAVSKQVLKNISLKKRYSLPYEEYILWFKVTMNDLRFFGNY